MASESNKTLQMTDSMELPLKFSDWTVENTCQFLRKYGLEEFERKIKEHRITGRDLVDLDRLEQIDIQELDRRKIFETLKEHVDKIYFKKVFNDPIHGHIELHPLLVKIIDTPQFQRLRNIKQLGGGYSVYPGASHNRFEHSIGVGHLAGELAKSLESKQKSLIDERDILCVQIAGLCHDLGHGPFSHVFDGMFIPEAIKTGQKWKHEDASIDMLHHLLDDNDLKPLMKLYGLKIDETDKTENDLLFIEEMIRGPQKKATDEAPWPYEGRTEEKSFLYEIVSNKENGIDVDKFDYFARDCHYLGIKNNFDHNRFITFARVCGVNGRKHICSRDKEVENLYDMFHTRNCLHRRAYQHRVKVAVELMIKDVLLKADEHFKFSKAKDDMKAYTQLTDQVFEKILHHRPGESIPQSVDEARQILQRIMSRDLYRLLGEVKPKKDEEKISVEKIKTLEDELTEIVPESAKMNKKYYFETKVARFDYGMKDKDPIKNTYFYNKADPTEGFKISEEQKSKLRPECFSEEILRVYWKNPEPESLKKAEECFKNWCQKNQFLVLGFSSVKGIGKARDKEYKNKQDEDEATPKKRTRN